MKALVSALALAACFALAALAPPAHAFGQKPKPDPSKLDAKYAQLLARYRPDLAIDWGVETPADEPFLGLDEASVDAHLRQLRELHAQAKALPPSASAESLAVRLEREIAQTEPGGLLHRDHLLWLDIVSAAARAPVVAGSMSGCVRAVRITRQLRAVPEALRGAAVLLRAAPPPDGLAFETRINRVEWLFRQDLPSRTEACRESRRLAEFTQADTLAARALAVFRRRVTTSP
jgi:hypothetical protein